MAKTFIPTLVRLLTRTCIYISKYRATILLFVPEGGENALNGIVTACEVFLDLVNNPVEI